MAEYLADVWQLLKDDKNIRFYLLESSRWKEGRPGTQEYIRKTLPVPLIRSRWIARMHWDLMIIADHARASLVDKKRCPTLFVPHGIESGLNLMNGQYTFSDFALDKKGDCRYTRMFAASYTNRNIAAEINNVFDDVTVVVGNLHDDKMLALAEQRDAIRSQMGFTSDDNVVLVLGAWGPQSLYNRMGDVILSQSRDLMGEFRFILNVHPHEYRPKPSGERVWGEYLRTQKKNGFIIREPDEDWIPYMVACDVILTDYTSLALHGTLLKRPVVYVPLPESLKNPESLVWRLYELSPVINDDASDLGDRLRQSLNDYPFGKLEELASQINSYPGQSRPRVLKELYSLLKLPQPETIK